MSPLLACEGLEVAYGPVQVLFGVDLTIEQGEVVALLGVRDHHEGVDRGERAAMVKLFDQERERLRFSIAPTQ